MAEVLARKRMSTIKKGQESSKKAKLSSSSGEVGGEDNGPDTEKKVLKSRGQRQAANEAARAGLLPFKALGKVGKCVPCVRKRPSSNDVPGLNLNLDEKGVLKMTSKEREYVDMFKRFLAVKTVSAEGPFTGAYHEAVRILKKIAEGFGIACEIVNPVKDKPILLCTVPGTDPSLPSLLLNSHYDVVPAVDEMWHTNPFDPKEEANGDIYARGAQDMKCVCIQHLIAVGKIVASGEKMLRNVHLTFVPDEEIGGSDGLGTFVKMPRFKALNVGVALDEGLARADKRITVFYGERAVWWCRVECRGKTGHGSRFVKQTAVGKLLRILGKIQAFRATEEAKLYANKCTCGLKLGDVTSINITMLEAGVKTTVDEESGVQNYAFNVVPEVARAGFDTRVPPSVNLLDYKKKIDSWAEEEGVTWEFQHCSPVNKVTSIDPDANVWWKTFKTVVPEAEPEIFPAGTDSRYLRELDIAAFGFSPMPFTPVLLHDHDEFINARIWLDGIGTFVRLITSLANVAANQG
eukprot:g1931.t1